MKATPQVSTRDGKQQSPDKTEDTASGHQPGSFSDEAAPLPHETDQTPGSQHEQAPRGVGKQAHEDIQKGLQDTDRRGGDDYQERTQNDTHANANSGGKR
ncbi:hypothetical protein [Paraburkholderia sp.]|uniref:hypothetical protein n=1 Tax=Paraburkholderia sp. TaxID=1926495 RepID=UPI0023A1FF6B|nr:hypothetical protein [Paraburkholderia sp.]MDE1184174.1 hypothetical protein [Paraburkholderia sp.]